MHIRRFSWVTFLSVVTWRLCAAGQVVPVPMDERLPVVLRLFLMFRCLWRLSAAARLRCFFSGSVKPAELS